MSTKIGVIAEENNDVEVLYELTSKIINEKDFAFSKFIGHGCGKLRRKTSSWAFNLLDRGCSHLVILHDLDDHDEGKLRTTLKKLIKGLDFVGFIILIPIFEIESWLLCDSDAIKKVFNLKNNPKLPWNPEAVRDPKKHLRDLVWTKCRKRYLNTIHNKKIAKEIQIHKMSKLKSFSGYPKFLGLLRD